MERMRLDVYLSKYGYFQSREKAKQALAEKRVYVNHMLMEQGKYLVQEQDEITILPSSDHYVGRGAWKLKHALEVFQLSLADAVVLDVGASTGGFTQVCLEAGARLVYALDVGKDQLDPSLRKDLRVVVMEQRNFRYAQTDWFDHSFDFICADVSFISLKHIIPQLRLLMQEDACAVLLVKPQFEAGPSYVNKHGVVKDQKAHILILQEITACARAHGLHVRGLIPSPIHGKDGNIEYLLYLSLFAANAALDIPHVVTHAFK